MGQSCCVAIVHPENSTEGGAWWVCGKVLEGLRDWGRRGGARRFGSPDLVERRIACEDPVAATPRRPDCSARKPASAKRKLELASTRSPWRPRPEFSTAADAKPAPGMRKIDLAQLENPWLPRLEFPIVARANPTPAMRKNELGFGRGKRARFLVAPGEPIIHFL